MRAKTRPHRPSPGIGGKQLKSGFTLIEALVALVILAIASTTLMAASSAHIERVGRLEDRALAQLVAENRLVELRLLHAPPEDGRDRVTMGRHDWDVVTSTTSTNNPELVDVKIAVSLAGTDDPLLTLRGFIDAGKLP